MRRRPRETNSPQGDLFKYASLQVYQLPWELLVVFWRGRRVGLADEVGSDGLHFVGVFRPVVPLNFVAEVDQSRGDRQRWVDMACSRHRTD